MTGVDITAIMTIGAGTALTIAAETALTLDLWIPQCQAVSNGMGLQSDAVI